MRDCCDNCGFPAAIRTLAYLRVHELFEGGWFDGPTLKVNVQDNPVGALDPKQVAMGKDVHGLCCLPWASGSWSWRPCARPARIFDTATSCKLLVSYFGSIRVV